MQLRHVGVFLQVTLYRRLAELSFRGAPFNQLPREVVREVRRDFDVICGAFERKMLCYMRVAGGDAMDLRLL